MAARHLDLTGQLAQASILRETCLRVTRPAPTLPSPCRRWLLTGTTDSRTSGGSSSGVVITTRSESREVADVFQAQGEAFEFDTVTGDPAPG